MNLLTEKVLELKESKKNYIKIHIIGWRGVDHPYATALESYFEPLMRFPNYIKIYFTDALYAYTGMKRTRYSVLDELPMFPAGEIADISFRALHPYDMSVDENAKHTIIYMTCDNMVLSSNLISNINLKPNVHVLTPSTYSKKGLVRSGIPDEKILTLPIGISDKETTKNNGRLLRQQLGVPENKYIYFGTENISLLLQTFLKLTDENIVLLLKNEDIGEIDTKYNTKVKCVNSLSVSEILSITDCYVSCHTNGAYHPIVLEALSRSINVICTKNSSMDDIAKDALFVKSSSVEGFETETINGTSIKRIRLEPNQRQLLRSMKQVKTKMFDPEHYTMNYSTPMIAFRFMEIIIKLLSTVKDSFYYRALQCFEKKETQCAHDYFKHIADTTPNNIDVLFQLGVIYQQEKHDQQALDTYKKILEIEPTNKEALEQLYIVYDILTKKTEDYTKMNNILEEMLVYFPNKHTLHFNIASLNQHLGNHNKAISHYKQCLELEPKSILAVNGLARTYHGMGKTKLSMFYARKGLEYEPTQQAFHMLLGLLHFDAKNYDGAIEHYTKGIELCVKAKDHQGEVMTYSNMGLCYFDFGMVNKTLECYDTIQRLKGVYKDELNDMKFSLFQNRILSYDYFSYDPNRFYEQRLEINDIYKHYTRYETKLKKKNKIKIGFISGDFYFHAVSQFAYNVLYHLDKNKFEVFCYKNKKNHDFVTTYLQEIPDIKWQDVSGMSDSDIAKIIFIEEIDILVDLSGMTIGTRLGVFAHKPAPIQLTYLGFPNTTGLKEIEYRLTDEIADPLESKQKYSEKLIRIPKSFLCYRNFLHWNELPIVYDTNPNLPIVFGTLNKLNKISDYVFRCWKIILERVPNSKMYLKIGTENKEVIDHFLNSLGITRDRLIKGCGQGMQHDFYKTYNLIHISLDTYPYSGTTTTCDSLYMGTPVITYYLAGEKAFHSHNVSTSILRNAGLDELVALSEEEYINKAVELANDRERIWEYKRTIREKFMRSTDPKEFIGHFEGALMQIYNEKLK
jgi:protein O-GlcNAc transferase